MSNQTYGYLLGYGEPDPFVETAAAAHSTQDSQTLAAGITRAASKQTYYIIRFLVDRGRVANAYRAYAYFRWLDDRLDGVEMDQAGRLAFLHRQRSLLDGLYQGCPPPPLLPEERILADLLDSDRQTGSGLHAYLDNMMAVMAFDANRRGRLISEAELDDYAGRLAAAVTEALHYFIGHDAASLHDGSRYQAARAAHIAHMLRDTWEDTVAGYYNIPREYLDAHHITPADLESEAYRAWVRGRVAEAQACFAAGRDYLARVPNRRCRLAGYTYIGRFTGVLNAIEAEGYRLRPNYDDCKSWGAYLKAWTVK